MIAIATRHIATKTQTQFSLHQLEAGVGSIVVGSDEGSFVETVVSGWVGTDHWVVRVVDFVVVFFVVGGSVVDVVVVGVVRILAPQSFPQYSWHLWPLYPVPSQSHL